MVSRGGFPDGRQVGCGRKSELGSDINVFELKTRTRELPPVVMGKATRKASGVCGGGEGGTCTCAHKHAGVPDFNPRYLSLKCVLDIQMEMRSR